MSSSDYVTSTFADQFERKGSDFIYRRNLRGAPIRVTAAERDMFVAGFRRSYKVLIAVMTVSVVLLLALVIALGGLDDGADPVMMGLGMAGAAIIFIVGVVWAVRRIYGAPARALAQRVAEGEPLTRDEGRRMTLSSISYGTFAMAAIFGFGITGLKAIKYDVWHGWGRLWWLPAIFLGGLSAVQAFRKWRMERVG
ncbi:hypothetical protein OF829_15630 [Sphingomonas sp. LB-2]|uniref:hypothetical protein n=1 Tax=Sphingomonas caeni TaxID=2984949 RepID=UPI00222EFC15|nr:hypothetical protein [Sphingomonas caeni]MCW3848666.1 hypothetical protein [Sphingomonas caeni]